MTPSFSDARDDDPRDGRSMAGRSASRPTMRGAAITRQQVEVLRDRIAHGVYDTPQMIDALARRIQQSGDL